MSNLLTSELTSPPKHTNFGDLMWSTKEEQRLINTYADTPRETLLRLFPDRTWIAIRQKARLLKLKKLLRWSADEEDLLRLLTERSTDFVLLSLFYPNRTPAAVRAKYYHHMSKFIAGEWS